MGFKRRSSSSNGLEKWWSLTDRQRQIGLMIMQGDMTRDEMADALGIGIKTVDSHRLTLLAALELANSVQLVHFGLRNRLLEIGE